MNMQVDLFKIFLVLGFSWGVDPLSPSPSPPPPSMGAPVLCYSKTYKNTFFSRLFVIATLLKIQLFKRNFSSDLQNFHVFRALLNRCVLTCSNLRKKHLIYFNYSQQTFILQDHRKPRKQRHGKYYVTC